MNEEWSKEELQASVEAYLQMQQKAQAGEHFVKAQHYKKLSEKFGRSTKAYDYRMRNISYVLSLMGRGWLDGLVPAQNVGANVAVQIEELLTQAEGRKSLPVVAFDIEVKKEAKKKNAPKPIGNQKPKATTSEVIQYQRDASVKAWILEQAGGKCECCEREAPFKGTDGLPFLEVHHIRQLADTGTDTVSNAVAVCPNCHRELHYGANCKSLVALLYARVSRLIPE